MSPELREFVLSLPLGVRQELAKCEGPAWSMASSEKYGTGLAACADTERAIVTDAHYWGRTAWLPVSPIAIALHAAKLGNYDTAQVRVPRRTGKTWAWVTVDPDPSAEWLGDRWTEADAESDLTGHRAAIALLRKVMDERKVPNAEP